MSLLSKRDIEILRPMVDRAVQKVLGFGESSLVTAAINCMDKGYDKRKTQEKLSTILDDKQALRFTDKLFDVMNDFNSSSKRKKRKEDKYEDEIQEKKRKFEDKAPANVPDPGNPSPGQLTKDKIAEMMATAQKTINERKAQLIQSDAGIGHVLNSQMASGAYAAEALQKQKRATELQARIQAQLLNTGMQSALGKTLLGSKPAPFILDSEGRTIDATTGEAIQLAAYTPTLKANIRAKKREEFKHTLAEKTSDDASDASFFDYRVSLRPAGRGRRQFRFHEKGKFEQLANRMRTKAQLEKLQNQISHAARKTGIESAAKLAIYQPSPDLKEGEIPTVEWWDQVIMQYGSYDDMYDETGEVNTSLLEGVTHLVEHPSQMQSPVEPSKPVQIPVMLTAHERKKLRRQNRGEAQKEITEKIRLGLMPPPEPKVRMANLMRVLGQEAIQDPTKIEAHVRAQMAKRQKVHEESNAARKLTPEQRKEKKINKIKEDTSLGVQVSVYRVYNLNNPAKKFKVEMNAKQLYMTGFVALAKDCNVVVVEGGPKQQKKFHRLMMHRIKWENDKTKGDDKDDDDEEKKVNRCDLVWQGSVKNRSFGEMKFKFCPTELFAREQFKKHSVEHYWDMAFSGAVLATDDS